MSRYLPMLFFFLLLLHAKKADADTLDLAPIIKEGTPGDLLMQDPIVPSSNGATGFGTGSGTIQKSLSDQIALPVIGTSTPGGNVQFRGLGRSAEDTDVQAFGIPLNPAQGGGFDLSIFPQFLWSSYEFQPGPALGTFDPRGTAGSLTLVPWTAHALNGAAGLGRVIALGSTANLFQVSAAASDGKALAAIVGTSAGDAQGPSAGLSGRWRLTEQETLSFHLLMTDVDAKTPGPGGLTPYAHQQTVRGIPLLQLDSKLGSQAVLKTSLFFDGEYLRYDDPSYSALPATQDHVYQVGTEDALLWGDWKFGLGLRGVRYQSLGFADQSEAVFDLMASRTIEPTHWLLIEPSVRAVGVSTYGMVPEASLGARIAASEQASFYARAGLSRHFPSMINRYYSYPGFPGYPAFVGNPALQPEEDWTGTLGFEWKSRLVRAGLQAYGQYTQDTQVRAPLDASTDTELNLGNAQMAALLGSLDVFPASWATLGAQVTLSSSQLSRTGLAFPGQPAALAVFSAGLNSIGELAGGGHLWELHAFERLSSTSVATAAGGTLPSYHEEDVELRAQVQASWLGIARLEDVTDQRPELVKGYPSFGRTFSLLVSKQL